MGINGISTDYYQAGYVNSKASKAEEGKSFAEIATQKVAPDLSCIKMTDSGGDNLYEKINYGSYGFTMDMYDDTGRVFFFS